MSLFDRLSEAAEDRRALNEPVRRKLPDERKSITHKFDITGHEGFITVGLYEDGKPGELFLTMAKEGSTISGFADAFVDAFTVALQYGVPLEVLVERFSHARFEPSGMTRNPDVRFAKSIVDYIARWMKVKFLTPGGAEEARQLAQTVEVPRIVEESGPGPEDPHAPPCNTCGSITVRSGKGYKCPNCSTYIQDKDVGRTE